MQSALCASTASLWQEDDQEAQIHLWDAPELAEASFRQVFLRAAQGQFLEPTIWQPSVVYPFQHWAAEPAPSLFPLLSSGGLTSAASVLTVGTIRVGRWSRVWQIPTAPGLRYTIKRVAWEPDESAANTASFTRNQIDGLLKALDRFPVCYNQTLLRGSLTYCRRAVGRGATANKVTLQAILSYVELIAASITPFEGGVPAGWASLDFTLYSDRFENVQRVCAEMGYLPTLENMTIEDAREA